MWKLVGYIFCHKYFMNEIPIFIIHITKLFEDIKLMKLPWQWLHMHNSEIVEFLKWFIQNECSMTRHDVTLDVIFSKSRHTWLFSDVSTSDWWLIISLSTITKWHFCQGLDAIDVRSTLNILKLALVGMSTSASKSF